MYLKSLLQKPGCTLKSNKWVLLWCNGLRIQHCHCSSFGHCCGANWVPGLGTSASWRCGQKIKNKINGKISKSSLWYWSLGPNQSRSESLGIKPRDQYVCVYIFTCRYRYVCVCMCASLYTHTHTHTHTLVYKCVCKHTFLFIYMCGFF